jgi:hypothetical protein
MKVCVATGQMRLPITEQACEEIGPWTCLGKAFHKDTSYSAGHRAIMISPASPVEAPLCMSVF